MTANTPDGAPRPAPHIVLMSSNLLGATRVSGVVRGYEMQFQGARELSLVESLDQSQLRAVLVDLDLGVDLTVLDALIENAEVQRIAFGSHVDTEKLQAAADAGWNVLTRGQFDTMLPNLAQQWQAMS